MMIRPIALLAILIPGCVSAADSTNAALAIYYSFDAPASAGVFSEMQAELDRILAPAGLRVTWRRLDSPRNGDEYFPGIAVLHFRGSCWCQQVSGAAASAVDSPIARLAYTERVDGQVLPFGAVDCDRLQRFLVPALKLLPSEERNTVLGRAMARVSAHEVYHMLTGSGSHASQGIASASHSLADLIAPSFTFATKETNWLRAWLDQQAGKQPLATTERGEAESEAPVAAVVISGR